MTTIFYRPTKTVEAQLATAERELEELEEARGRVTVREQIGHVDSEHDQRESDKYYQRRAVLLSGIDKLKLALPIEAKISRKKKELETMKLILESDRRYGIPTRSAERDIAAKEEELSELESQIFRRKSYWPSTVSSPGPSTGPSTSTVPSTVTPAPPSRDPTFHETLQALKGEVTPTDKEGDECSLCLTNHKTVVLVPCGHMCYCVACCHDPSSQISETCPICRKKALSAIQTFR
jgi:hypothetical protein